MKRIFACCLILAFLAGCTAPGVKNSTAPDHGNAPVAVIKVYDSNGYLLYNKPNKE